ncbi:MAG TPA: hypothetical protein G4O17_00285 [Dehalococcoidia bacterium]|nr:hypothetical protein [Dehalococcoidia bacterium]
MEALITTAVNASIYDMCKAV